MKKIFLFWLLAVFSVEGFGCASTSSNRGPQNVLDDSNLVVKVKTRLAGDPTLNLFKIDVDMNQGVATLTGSLPTESRKRRAADIAASVEGVKGVENLIQVGETRIGESFNDAVITSKVTSGLIREPLTHSLSIEVQTKSGKVVLTGRVESEDEKKVAERIALNTDGVVTVENQLQVMTE